MPFDGRRIGFVVCGSHCNLEIAVPIAGRLVERGAEVYPITSRTVAETATRFGGPEDWLGQLAGLCDREPLTTIPEVEPLGPQKTIDLIVACPFTGNSTAKLANAITDSPALMAIKGQLRNERPVLLAVTTNDGLGLNAKNVGLLLATKDIYFVPFGQDAPEVKPNSISADWTRVVPAAAAALSGEQMQPVLLPHGGGTPA